MRPDKKRYAESESDIAAEQVGDGAAEGEARETSQAERAVMQPERDDPEWRYYHQIWQS